jgi:hypothetical protein
MGFHDDFINALKSGRTGRSTNGMNEQVACLRDIKDIRDEIHIIQTTLQSQMEVFETITDTANKKSTELELASVQTVWEDLKHEKTIYTHRERMKRLDEDAERVEKSVSTGYI